VLVYVRRAKTTGPYEKVPFAISASFMVAVLEVYRDCFLPEDRTGRFFRYVKEGSDGKWRGTNAVIGTHSYAKVTILAATWLGLDDPNRFTAHGIRRSGATILANGGVSSQMLKLAGGWKSDTAAERSCDICAYICSFFF
jgi:integrase